MSMRPLFASAICWLRMRALACPTCKNPEGSGGKRVTTRPCHSGPSPMSKLASADMAYISSVSLYLSNISRYLLVPTLLTIDPFLQTIDPFLDFFRLSHTINGQNQILKLQSTFSFELKEAKRSDFKQMRTKQIAVIHRHCTIIVFFKRVVTPYVTLK